MATREAWVFDLRNDGSARSNLALGTVTAFPQSRLRVELYSGETGQRLATMGPCTLSTGGRSWMQLDSVLSGHAAAHGYARIVNETPSGFFAYGVVNDRGTDDGSYLEMDGAE